jgi:hypothetical protein
LPKLSINPGDVGILRQLKPPHKPGISSLINDNVSAFWNLWHGALASDDQHSFFYLNRDCIRRNARQITLDQIVPGKLNHTQGGRPGGNGLSVKHVPYNLIQPTIQLFKNICSTVSF